MPLWSLKLSVTRNENVREQTQKSSHGGSVHCACAFKAGLPPSSLSDSLRPLWALLSHHPTEPCCYPQDSSLSFFRLKQVTFSLH